MYNLWWFGVKNALYKKNFIFNVQKYEYLIYLNNYVCVSENYNNTTTIRLIHLYFIHDWDINPSPF